MRPAVPPPSLVLTPRLCETGHIPSRRSAFARPVVAAPAAVLAAAGLVVVQSAPPAAPTAQAAPAWCASPEPVTTPVGVCTTLTGPEDCANPAGATIEVTVSNLPARHPGARRGVLFGNSGGPGRDPLTYFDDNEL